MDKQIILLVEDDKRLNEGNRLVLESEGYTVFSALTLAGAREHLTTIKPDVILLDVIMPDGSGMDFCNVIQGETDAHIIFLTGCVAHEDMLRGLAMGGDDYIKKPFKLDELLTRVAAAMRRRVKGTAPVTTLSFGSLAIDIVSGRAYAGGADLLLQPKEFALLRMFAENENRILGAEYIYEAIWNMPLAGNKNSVRSAVYRLRKKLESTGYDVSVTREKGYVFGNLSVSED